MYIWVVVTRIPDAHKHSGQFRNESLDLRGHTVEGEPSLNIVFLVPRRFCRVLWVTTKVSLCIVIPNIPTWPHYTHDNASSTKDAFWSQIKKEQTKIISSDFYFDIISSNIYIESLKSRDIRSNSSLMPIETLNKIAGLFIGTIFVNCTQFFRPLLLAPCDRGGNISCSLVSYYLVVFQKQVVRSSRRGSGRSIGAILPWLRDMVRASRPSRTPITLRQVGSRTESTLRAQAHSKTYRLLQESVPTWNIQVYERGLSNHAK